MTINVLASLTVTPGSGPDLEAAVAAVRDAVLAEPGCGRYDLQRKARSEVEYVMIERWDSVDDLKVHGTSPAFTELGAAISGLLASAPEVVVYEPVGGQVF